MVALGSMKKALVYLVVVLLVVVGGWYWYSGQKGGAALTLHPDLYPLYSGAMWGDVQPKTTIDGPGFEVASKPFTDITNIAEKSMPFEKYYEDKLAAAGWVRDDMRAASGPGANITYYTKGDEFIVVFFHSDFKVKNPDAPSECPCDVQLSLISGTQ